MFAGAQINLVPAERGLAAGFYLIKLRIPANTPVRPPPALSQCIFRVDPHAKIATQRIQPYPAVNVNLRCQIRKGQFHRRADCDAGANPRQQCGPGPRYHSVTYAITVYLGVRYRGQIQYSPVSQILRENPRHVGATPPTRLTTQPRRFGQGLRLSGAAARFGNRRLENPSNGHPGTI